MKKRPYYDTCSCLNWCLAVFLTAFSGLCPRYGLTYAEIEIFGDAETKRRAGVRSGRR
jgi:hypothetical protein